MSFLHVTKIIIISRNLACSYRMSSCTRLFSFFLHLKMFFSMTAHSIHPLDRPMDRLHAKVNAVCGNPCIPSVLGMPSVTVNIGLTYAERLCTPTGMLSLQCMPRGFYLPSVFWLPSAYVAICRAGRSGYMGTLGNNTFSCSVKVHDMWRSWRLDS